MIIPLVNFGENIPRPLSKSRFSRSHNLSSFLLNRNIYIQLLCCFSFSIFCLYYPPAESQNITKNLTASSSFKITFNVYSDAGFINLLTESDVVDTDQDVYLKAELNHITELDLIGTLCYTTPTEDPMDSNNFTIITDG